MDLPNIEIKAEDLISNLIPILIGLVVIFILRWCLLGVEAVIRRKQSEGLTPNPMIKSLVNWVTFYSVILFLLFYFQSSQWMFESLISIGDQTISVFLIILVILIISLTLRISKILRSYVFPSIYNRYDLDRGVQFTFDKIFHYAIILLGVFISLSTIGIKLSALTVFAGIVGVGIGFGLQNIASNFISGIILLFERPIKVGDRVLVDDIIGDVERINMRATVIRTLDNERIIVPNSYFLEEKVINRSYGDRVMRLVLPVGVAYGSDVHKVREVLLQVAIDEQQRAPIILSDPEPYVNFVGFGSSSLDFELFVWIAEPEKVIVTKSQLNFQIYDKLNEHHIEIPFPQRDLHIKSVDGDVWKKSDGEGS
ncbi:mechanosensitive ion channel family protein [Pontibacillus salicampi]|uniref:Mechanosensitive ion channel family protein n=1 Tax=Pontibacillus salicampi TaxID=1449801 RepID=A0ABV6LPX2_9BACI